MTPIVQVDCIRIQITENTELYTSDANYTLEENL